jgi:hypothetical protein
MPKCPADSPIARFAARFQLASQLTQADVAARAGIGVVFCLILISLQSYQETPL